MSERDELLAQRAELAGRRSYVRILAARLADDADALSARIGQIEAELAALATPEPPPLAMAAAQANGGDEVPS